MKKLLCLVNDCPSSGKTTLAEVLQDFYRARSLHPSWLTTDRTGPLPSGHPLREPQAWEMENEQDLDQLIKAIDGHDTVIVDIATGDAPSFCRFFDDLQLADVLPEIDCELSMVIPVKLESGDFDSIVELAEIVSDNADYLVSTAFSIGCEGEHDTWDGSYGQEVMSYLSSIEVASPRVSESLAEALDVAGHDLASAIAVQEDLPEDLHSLLLRWKAKYSSQLQEDGIEYLVANHEELHTATLNGDSAVPSKAIAC